MSSETCLRCGLHLAMHPSGLRRCAPSTIGPMPPFFGADRIKAMEARIAELEDGMWEALACAEGGYIHPDDVVRLRAVLDLKGGR